MTTCVVVKKNNEIAINSIEIAHEGLYLKV